MTNRDHVMKMEDHYGWTLAHRMSVKKSMRALQVILRFRERRS